MAVDVAPYAGPGQKLHVVVRAEQADVIDLGNAGHKKLNGTRDEIEGLIAAERVKVGAVDLVEVEVVGRGTGGLFSIVLSAAMYLFDKVMDGLGRKQAGIALLVGGDIDDADTVMRIEHGDGVSRPDLHPFAEWLGIGRIKGMQNQRRQREIVDPIDPAGDLDLLLVIAVHLDENFHVERTGLPCELIDESEGFGDHETAGAGFLDGVTDSVKSDGVDAGCMEAFENGAEIGLTLRMRHVDVNLLRRERGPDQLLYAIAQTCVGKRKSRPRPIDAEQVGFRGTSWGRCDHT